MPSEVLKRKASLFSVFFTFAVDYLGATIVFPIFAPMFLDSSEHLISSHYSLSFKTIVLGLFLGVFPFMQFIFSPVLGEYSDHHGRKRGLVVTAALTCIGYFFIAWGIVKGVLAIVFFGRVIMGIGSGNLSICLSALSDLSTDSQSKLRYYSFGSAIAGLTFILGPFIGGKLSDPLVSKYFGLYFPMLMGGFFSFINVIFIIFFFSETLVSVSKKPFGFFVGFKNSFVVFSFSEIKKLYIVYFFYLLSWNIVFLFIPAFVLELFSLSHSKIGDVCALLGVCWIFGTVVLHYFFHKYKYRKRVVFLSFLLFSVGIFYVQYIDNMVLFLILLGGCTVLCGLIWPLCAGAISDEAPSSIQGKVLGVSQSVLSLTMVFSSVIGGLFFDKDSGVLFVLASICALIAAVCSLRSKI